MPEIVFAVHETATLTLRGSAFQIARFNNGQIAFSNRNYQWQEIPPALGGKFFTRLAGGGKPTLEITAKVDNTIQIATATGQRPLNQAVWSPTDQSFSYTDANQTRMAVFTCPLKKGATLRLPSNTWTGTILIFDGLDSDNPPN